MFLVQAFIFLFIAVTEAMERERLLIKSLLGEKCPREAYIEEIKAWVDCDEDETIEENLMQPSEKCDLQAESSWWPNGCNSTVLDDMHWSYGEAASLSYCTTRGQFWWENVCMGVRLTLLLFHQQAQPCQAWQLVCTSDKKQRFTTQWRRDHLLCSIASEIPPPNRCWPARRAITE